MFLCESLLRHNKLVSFHSSFIALLLGCLLPLHLALFLVTLYLPLQLFSVSVPLLPGLLCGSQTLFDQ